ncbi:helix-turn-helix domain-containing protein [Kineococcus gypseus]|uniref:helix-turn-helix domain-containing protein n=1 Tax=Kineococcus gypseus TaxID=1637102 RepID=UPI003D7C6DF0
MDEAEALPPTFLHVEVRESCAERPERAGAHAPAQAPARARTVAITELGSLRLAVVSGEGLLVRRGLEHVQADATEQERLLLAFMDRGRAVIRQDGHEAYIESEEFTLLDSARPFTSAIEVPFASRVFSFPKAALGVADRDLAQLTAVPLRRDHALSPFLLPFLGRLSSSGASLHPSTREQLARNVTDILATLISDHLTDAPLEDAARRTLLLRVKAYVQAHLDDPELCAQSIAVHHHISVRYLYKLFAGETTSLSRYVLHCRLERCRRDLTTVDPRSASVAQIAYRWGFSSPAHFSRVFRDAYAMSPREYQARHNLCSGERARRGGRG